MHYLPWYYYYYYYYYSAGDTPYVNHENAESAWTVKCSKICLMGLVWQLASSIIVLLKGMLLFCNIQFYCAGKYTLNPNLCFWSSWVCNLHLEWVRERSEVNRTATFVCILSTLHVGGPSLLYWGLCTGQPPAHYIHLSQWHTNPPSYLETRTRQTALPLLHLIRLLFILPISKGWKTESSSSASRFEPETSCVKKVRGVHVSPHSHTYWQAWSLRLSLNAVLRRCVGWMKHAISTIYCL